MQLNEDFRSANATSAMRNSQAAEAAQRMAATVIRDSQAAEAAQRFAATVIRDSQAAEAAQRFAATVMRHSQAAEAAQRMAATVMHLSQMVEMASAGNGLDTEADRAEAGFPLPHLARQMISRREVAAYFTVAMFLLVYISLSRAISQDAQLAMLTREDGPTPFEAAMAVGALTFWLVMSWRRGD